MTFNYLYLQNLCKRRGMQPAEYTSYSTTDGYAATVVVNERRYYSERRHHRSREAAEEDAASVAWNICREESSNGGVGPNGQGVPVAGSPASSSGASAYASSHEGSDGVADGSSDELSEGGTLCICGRPYARSESKCKRCPECLLRVRYL